MWVGRARAASLRDGKETAKLVGVKPLQARRQSRQKPRSRFHVAVEARRRVGGRNHGERTRQGPGHERSHMPGRGAWVLQSRFSAGIIIIIIIGEGNGNPLQYSCLENPMDRGAHGRANPQGRRELDTTWRLSTVIIIQCLPHARQVLC